MPPLNPPKDREHLPLLEPSPPDARAAFSRREFLALMAASAALAETVACKQPREAIVPYVHPPEQGSAVETRFFATAMALGGVAQGLLVRSHMGRPTKIEGNPSHPTSVGATDVLAQASLRELYDPDRSRAVIARGSISGWSAARAALRQALTAAGESGEGFHILSEPVVSPTLAAQRAALLSARPRLRWHAIAAVENQHQFEATRATFGRLYDLYYRLDRARVIVCLDADLLCEGSASVRYARDFADVRRFEDASPQRNRLYVFESSPSGTGAAADHRVAMSPLRIAALAHALEIRLAGGSAADRSAPRALLDVLAHDLQQHRGTSLIVAGQHLPAPVHAAVHRLNHMLGNVGSTVVFIEPLASAQTAAQDALAELDQAIRARAVRGVLLLGANPAYTHPRSALAARLREVPFSMHLGLYFDETARRCLWHVPEAHYLESWSDTRGHDGTASIVQPLIEPLYDGRTSHEVVDALLSERGHTPYSLVRAHWRTALGQDVDFDRLWPTMLRTGVIPRTAFAPQSPAPTSPAGQRAAPRGAPDELELVLRLDPSVWDGRFANNAWLQECPKPITKLTWDNAVLLSPATAAKLGLTTGAMSELNFRGESLRAPVLVVDGHAEDCATLHFGYGRSALGRAARHVGVNAYVLRAPDAPFGGPGLRARKVPGRYVFAFAQTHLRPHGRDPVEHARADALRSAAAALPALLPDQPQTHLYKDPIYPVHAWGMVIDLDVCTGCNACVIACQAENNVPVVGKAEVLRSREMHWLRIDTYVRKEPQGVAFDQQPMLCVHCERAPCELVCPVEATAHSSEGLNEMVYNRCVGTRYCSNNCPYKVRRFNFFGYSETDAAALAPMYNPDVTVRGRGVMEKCTYCVQRIESARITAAVAGRPLRGAEVVTACQGACPTRAIVFGDLNDTTSTLARMRRSPRNYSLLGELGTEPRTTYLARVPNPHPSITDLPEVDDAT